MADQQETQSEHAEVKARQHMLDKDEANFDADLEKITTGVPKICPECGYVFQGNGWDGIDAHWKARHDDIMPYKEAWPLLKAGTYTP